MFFYFTDLSLKNGGRWSNLVTISGFSNVKSIKITHIFHREETDADRCNLSMTDTLYNDNNPCL